jgi:hypothetical protein
MAPQADCAEALAAAPAIASNAPEAKPASARGRRRLSTISSITSDDDVRACSNASITRSGDSAMLPSARDATNKTSAATASAVQMAAARLAFMPRAGGRPVLASARIVRFKAAASRS